MSRISGIIAYTMIFTIMAVFIFSRCAKEVAPVGGPRDTIPPKLLNSKPPNYSVNFSSDKVEVEFNEFIEFNDLQKQFLSSPPFDEEPDINMKGKGLIIEFNEPLKDSTTYTLNFGNAIVDYTEGNPYMNFKYVFSTGPVLDSLEVEGIITDAFNLKPKENILVMLYDNLKDSVPYYTIPDYVSRTGEDGKFTISNIRKDTFKIFALGDKNANYLYDNIAEPIAYQDSFITFEMQWIERDDTIFNDLSGNRTIKNITDSLVIDTIIHKEYFGYPPESVSLRLFEEEEKRRYLMSSQRVDQRKVDFIFNKSIGDSVKINLLDSSSLRSWYIQELSDQRDTLTYWIKDSSLYNRRYLGFTVDYQSKDSLNRDIWVTDTLENGYSFEKGEKRRTDTVKLSSNAGNRFDLNRDLSLKHPYPTRSIDTGRICLYKQIEDTILQEENFRISRDDEDLNNIMLDVDWKEKTEYTLQVLPQAIQSMYEVYHDTLLINFNTRAADYYGSLIVELSGVNSEIIMQLIKTSNEEEKVIREQYTEDIREGNIRFDYLDPHKFKLKLIFDRNANKKWDTGNYLKNIQPEKVIYHPRVFDVRSNWEYEIEWNASDTIETKSDTTETKRKE